MKKIEVATEPFTVHPERSRGATSRAVGRPSLDSARDERGRSAISANPASGLSPWLQAVDRAVRAIPRGQTASYARVALMAGKPGAARAVVQALHRLEGIPWWRVLRSDGTLAPQVASEQAKRLEKEGVKLRRTGGRVSLIRVRSRP